MTKEEFLNRYNIPRTVDEALRKGINAAVQHNRLYNTNDHRVRMEVKNYWKKRLQQLSEDFRKENWNEEDYENKIIELKENMNHRFGQMVNFRISHSQKSLSVFFKHLWCLDKLLIPPQCPVDRIILTRANAPYNQRNWTFIDDINTHRERYTIIRNASINDGFINVSEWELMNFN